MEKVFFFLLFPSFIPLINSFILICSHSIFLILNSPLLFSAHSLFLSLIYASSTHQSLVHFSQQAHLPTPLRMTQKVLPGFSIVVDFFTDWVTAVAFLHLFAATITTMLRHFK
ncbi:hypothetical protein RND81_05G204800 [Saponaria officinalis]|uniref:Uncharacterized protein n=1 Tax=Saponaria officinalis TaxID=3572 RepID=A0AAW1L2S9_SAPOF